MSLNCELMSVHTNCVQAGCAITRPHSAFVSGEYFCAISGYVYVERMMKYHSVDHISDSPSKIEPKERHCA
jgi:hypothetical protein